MEASEVVVFKEEELLFEEASEVMVFREASDVEGRSVSRGVNTHPYVTHVTRYSDSPVDQTSSLIHYRLAHSLHVRLLLS
jgi:hypothetical protein